jgi:uncharacterized membrane protein HdeD (DUF308 family)
MTSSIHNTIGIYCATGCAVSLLSTSLYFFSRQYQDFERVKINDRSIMDSEKQKRKKLSNYLIVVAIIMFITGLVLIVLSIGLYRDEKEENSTTISGMILQARAAENQPSTNEPIILAAIAAAVILAGTFQCCRNFSKTSSFGVIGMFLFAGGWLAEAFAGSMHTNSISSIQGDRLKWTIPGAFGICLGTFLIPYEYKHEYVAGLSMPIAALGYVCYTVGNNLVMKSSF